MRFDLVAPDFQDENGNAAHVAFEIHDPHLDSAAATNIARRAYLELRRFMMHGNREPAREQGEHRQTGWMVRLDQDEAWNGKGLVVRCQNCNQRWGAWPMAIGAACLECAGVLEAEPVSDLQAVS